MTHLRWTINYFEITTGHKIIEWDKLRHIVFSRHSIIAPWHCLLLLLRYLSHKNITPWNKRTEKQHIRYFLFFLSYITFYIIHPLLSRLGSPSLSVSLPGLSCVVVPEKNNNSSTSSHFRSLSPERVSSSFSFSSAAARTPE